MLHRFTQILVAATFILIFIGGMVTSKGAGLAVPDWPLSYGSLNPPGWWHIENVRIEHGHRLWASFVGLLTTVLAVWLWKTDPRKWVRWLGVTAFFAVLLQGILGGLRVVLISTPFAILHACIAQAFFCLTILLAMVTSPDFKDESGAVRRPQNANRIKILALTLFIFVYCQLIAGALMRHLGAGLAIPDFPLMFGRLLPPFQDSRVIIHFLHRLGALAVTLSICAVAGYVLKYFRDISKLLMPALALVGLVAFQIFLGAQIIWLMRPPVVTTLHVLTGALILGVSFVVFVRSLRLTR